MAPRTRFELVRPESHRLYEHRQISDEIPGLRRKPLGYRGSRVPSEACLLKI